MALSLQKSSDRGTVGLDIDGRFLAAVQVAAGRVGRLVSHELPEGLVRDGEVARRRGAGRGAQGLRRGRRASQERPARRVEPADRGAPDRAAADRGREAARRRRALPGRRGDRDAARRGGARLPGGRATPTAPTARPRMQVVVVAARRSMVESLLEAVKAAGLKPEGVDLDAFALVRTLRRRRRGRRRDARACSATSAASPTWPSPSAPSCFFTRARSSTVWDDADAGSRSPTRSASRSTTTWRSPRRGRSARSCCRARAPATAARREPRRPPRPAGVGGRAARRARHARRSRRGDDPFRYTVAAGLALGAAA